MAGTLRLVNTGGSNGQTTVTAAGTADRTINLPDEGGTLLINSGTTEHILPSGTVGSPGLAVVDDLDTGLYAPAANTLAVTTSGTETARFNANQQLLLNDTTDTSNARLIVRGNLSGDGFGGIIGLKRTNNTPSATNPIGLLISYTSDSEVVSRIETRRDNGTWTAATSYPTAIDFYTVEDGTAVLRDQPTLSLSSRGAVTFDGDVGFDLVNRSPTNTLSHILARCQTQCQRISTVSSASPGIFDIGPVDAADHRYEIVMIGAHNSSSVNATGYYLATVRSNSTTIVVQTIHETMSGAGSNAAFAVSGSSLRMTITNNGGTAYRNLTVTVRSSSPNANAQYIAMDSTLGAASPS
jgi:hypothetical protein